MLIGQKILLVEDDIFIRELYESFLKDVGYTVVTAQTGPEGVEKFRSEVFDLVLLDILLPGMDGLKVLDEVFKLNSKVPVVMLTNLFQEEFVKRSFEHGAIGYVLKARITKKDLLREVEGFLKARVAV